MKRRPQITADEVIKFLQACPRDLLVFCSESEYSEEEPHELIYDEEKKSCTVIEITESCPGKRYITFGYANEDLNSQS